MSTAHAYQDKCPWCNPEIIDKAHERALLIQVEADHATALDYQAVKNQRKWEIEQLELARQGHGLNDPIQTVSFSVGPVRTYQPTVFRLSGMPFYGTAGPSSLGYYK